MRLACLLVFGGVLTLVSIGCSEDEPKPVDVDSKGGLVGTEADARFGLAQGTRDFMGTLGLNQNATMFNYGFGAMAYSNVRTFQHCSAYAHEGCAEVSNAAALPDSDLLRDRAGLINTLRASPGYKWVVFNEADWGDSYVDPTQFARIYHAYFVALNEAFGGDRNQFQIVFPGVAGGNPNHQAWIQQTFAAYRSLYPGEEFPTAAWMFHIYPGGNCGFPEHYASQTTWAGSGVQSQISSFATFVGSTLEGGVYAATPVWVTEWGWIRNTQTPANPADDTSAYDNTAPCVADFVRDVGLWMRSAGIAQSLYFPQKYVTGQTTSADIACTYADGTACRFWAPWPDSAYNPSVLIDAGLTAQFGAKVLQQDKINWPAWSGWLWDGDQAFAATLTAPGEQYWNVSRGIWSSGWTPLHPTNDYWQFAMTDWDRDSVPDLMGIVKGPTGSGTTEVHILSGASNYRQWLLKTGTAMPTVEDGRFEYAVGDWDRDGVPDLFTIAKIFTGSGHTEVHVLSGASNFTQFLLQIATPIHPTDANFDFELGDWDRDGLLDLFMIAKSGGSATTEVHILSGASNFQTMLLSTPTGMGPTDSGFAFGIADRNADGWLDLYIIKRRGESLSTEVHVLSGATLFRDFIEHTGTGLHTTDATYDFAFADRGADGVPDLFTIRKSGAASASTELMVVPY